MSATVSNRLLDKLNGAAYKARQEAMLAAWRDWRTAIVRAMTAELDKPEPDEDECGALHVELVHCSTVLDALLPNADSEIAIEPADDA